MQKIKVTLLSNNFMARICALSGLYKYIINSEEETDLEIDTFFKKVTFDKPFKEFVRHECKVPKIMSDIWEALSAAILKDGGWTAL